MYSNLRMMLRKETSCSTLKCNGRRWQNWLSRWEIWHSRRSLGCLKDGVHLCRQETERNAFSSLCERVCRVGVRPTHGLTLITIYKQNMYCWGANMRRFEVLRQTLAGVPSECMCTRLYKLFFWLLCGDAAQTFSNINTTQKLARTSRVSTDDTKVGQTVVSQQVDEGEQSRSPAFTVLILTSVCKKPAI